MSEDPTQNLPNSDLKLILVRLDSIDARLDSINTRLTTLEDKVERRLLETRPIWESVLEQLKEMSAQLTEVNVRLTRVELESNDLRRLFRAGFNDLARVQDNFDERLEKFEGRNNPR
jgi:predicted nuclease with TOPRIM domain